ncbi:hypothetical protein COCCADRAFT_25767 [Bipolaris zeicola 26-R-13]|uniref:Uncharacterized protein n=1 Tax=Cochliobolus carbonum (strain 26-R-13) TaxID=930089 RepID=W6Y7R7_COCC2|nr:uncharacterized protein COCCADRAFT_25767 [Bipolaris zeicola 26-R-13]EUC33978.1 hypothetical protein COCCADRAFT_25767 [Bipolaris zeicola 26-R-13]
MLVAFGDAEDEDMKPGTWSWGTCTLYQIRRLRRAGGDDVDFGSSRTAKLRLLLCITATRLHTSTARHHPHRSQNGALLARASSYLHTYHRDDQAQSVARPALLETNWLCGHRVVIIRTIGPLQQNPDFACCQIPAQWDPANCTVLVSVRQAALMKPFI